MIDINCHILPGMDDGPKILKETIAMAKDAVDQGIHTVIATPHHNNGLFINERDAIIGAADYVNSKLLQEGIPLLIIPGQEIHIYQEMIDDLKKGLLMPLNETTRYVLIELPEKNIPSYTTQLVFEMQIAGFIPIFSQPEKNSVIMEDPNQLYEIVKNGALIQMNASSIIGAAGKKVEKTAQQLLKGNMVHFIASNAHNMKKKRFNLQKAYAALDSSVRDVFQENSELLIHGRPVIKDAPVRINTKGFWNLFK